MSTYKQSIHRAISDLIKGGVLRKIREGEYGFVKDYERWTHLGRPRSNAFEQAYCAAQKRKNASNGAVNNGAYTHKSEPSTTALTVVSASDDGPSTVALTPEIAVVDANGLCDAGPPRTPVMERPRATRAKNELRRRRRRKPYFLLRILLRKAGEWRTASRTSRPTSWRTTRSCGGSWPRRGSPASTRRRRSGRGSNRSKEVFISFSEGGNTGWPRP